MILQVEERQQHVAVQAGVGKSGRGAVYLHWLWQNSGPNSKPLGVEPELWAQTSSLTCLIEVSEVNLDIACENILITELPRADMIAISLATHLFPCCGLRLSLFHGHC